MNGAATGPGEDAPGRRTPGWVSFVTGRHGRLLVVAAFVALLGAGLVARSHLHEVTAAGQSSFLPRSCRKSLLLVGRMSANPA